MTPPHPTATAQTPGPTALPRAEPPGRPRAAGVRGARPGNTWLADAGPDRTRVDAVTRPRLLEMP